MLSFGAAISACAHSHHWRSAVRVLKLNAADVVGYNGAVDACAKALMTASAVIQILPAFLKVEVDRSCPKLDELFAREATQWQWALTLCQNSDFLGRSFALEAQVQNSALRQSHPSSMHSICTYIIHYNHI